MRKIKDLKPKELTTGIVGYYVHGEQSSFGLVELKEGSTVPGHQHTQEQITYILEGKLDMIIGSQPCLLEAGMYYVIPSNVMHSAVAITDCKVIDAFSPVREDYK
jgi:quercetin dioxygenase-like cupin family protein